MGLVSWCGSMVTLNHPSPMRASFPTTPLVALALLAGASPGVAQPTPPDLSRAPLLPTQALLPAEPAAAPPSAPGRVRLFRFQPGFVQDLPWLDGDDRPPEADGDPGLDWISVA